MHKILRAPAFFIPAIVSFGIFAWIEFSFSNFDLTKGNLGIATAYYELVLGLLTLVFIPVFFGLSVYKIVYFTSFEKKDGAGILGSFFSILVTGCPACSITIATYLGLSSLISGLPFVGLEIRTLGVIMLIASTAYVYRTLYVCHRRSA